MKDLGEVSRAKKWYRVYLIAAVVMLVGAAVLYWLSMPFITVDFVLAVSLFVLILSNIQTFNLVFELDTRIKELESEKTKKSKK